VKEGVPKLKYRTLINAFSTGAIVGGVFGGFASQSFFSALIGAILGGIIAALIYGFIAFFRLVRRTENPLKSPNRL
tara:strand:+ start:508 stop:735 length:228 start_codon:yes stop_codon:yes gene_type:complete